MKKIKFIIISISILSICLCLWRVAKGYDIDWNKMWGSTHANYQHAKQLTGTWCVYACMQMLAKQPQCHYATIYATKYLKNVTNVNCCDFLHYNGECLNHCVTNNGVKISDYPIFIQKETNRIFKISSTVCSYFSKSSYNAMDYLPAYGIIKGSSIHSIVIHGVEQATDLYGNKVLRVYYSDPWFESGNASRNIPAYSSADDINIYM